MDRVGNRLGFSLPLCGAAIALLLQPLIAVVRLVFRWHPRCRASANMRMPAKAQNNQKRTRQRIPAQLGNKQTTVNSINRVGNSIACDYTQFPLNRAAFHPDLRN
jgi:hypothetical protein